MLNGLAEPIKVDQDFFKQIEEAQITEIEQEEEEDENQN